MKDILTTRLDMIHASLNSLGHFENLDQKRLTNLDGLFDLLCKIRDQLDNTKKAIDGAYKDLQKIFEDLDRQEKPRPVVIQGKIKIVQAKIGHEVKVTDNLYQELTKAVKNVTDIRRPRLSVINSDLSMIAVGSFRTNIKKIQEKIKEVYDDIAAANASSGDEAEQLHNQIWNKYWDEIYTPAQEIFGDYVDFMRGLATRDSKLDNEICNLADIMISKWSVKDISLTIPVKYVALESTMARIIRLSFQDWSTWSLPMVAREVSYVIHSRQRAGKEINDFIDEQIKENTQKDIHLRDYLADIYATYVMGPAYGYASVYLRFDPINNLHAYGNHIPDAYRAEAIFSMLEWMRDEKKFSFDAIIQELRTEWKRFLSFSGSPQEIELQEKKQIKDWVDDLVKFVHENDEGGLMYTAHQWEAAGLLKEKFVETRTFPYTGRYDVRDIMNAAWLVRGDDEIHINEINKAAENAIREIQGLKLPPPEQGKQSEEDRLSLAEGRKKDDRSWPT